MTANPRWALVTCYCALDNPAIAAADTDAPPRTAVETLDPHAILEAGQRHMARIATKAGGRADVKAAL